MLQLDPGRSLSDQLHSTNRVEQSYQDPALPEAYNVPAILDSGCHAASAQHSCPLAECDSASQVEQMVPVAPPPSPQLDTFSSRAW